MQTIHKDIYQDTILQLPLKIIASSWMMKKYYPVLSVTRTDKTLVVKYDRSTYMLSIDETNTFIPITYTTSMSTVYEKSIKLHWMISHRLSLEFDKTNWFMINIKQAGK